MSSNPLVFGGMNARVHAVRRAARLVGLASSKANHSSPAAARHAAPPTGEDAAAEVLARLRSGIRYECDKGHLNWPGTTQIFSAFLEEMLGRIAEEERTAGAAGGARLAPRTPLCGRPT